jgi:SAM-dependent methyltransferase
MGFDNTYEDARYAAAYAKLDFPGTYYLAYRDLPDIFRRHVKGTRALDFGCGAGRSTRFLRRHGFEVVGVDIAGEMLRSARALDPAGDYRLIEDDNLQPLGDASFHLVFCGFTFDNIPTLQKKLAILVELRRVLVDHGRLVCLVSAPEIYTNEWASFSTGDFPENRAACTGDIVRIVVTDLEDRRPVEDVLCTDDAYWELFGRTRLDVIETCRPLAKGDEPFEWIAETRISPWAIYVLGKI